MSAEGVFQYRTLSELADVAGGVALGRTVPDGASVELPYLRVANVQDGYIDTSEVKSVRVLQSEVARFALQRGDVLLTEGGDFDKLGRGAVWDGRLEPCLHQNHVFRVRCRPLLLPEFLSLYLSSEKGRRYFLSIAKQTTNLATISSSQLKMMPVLHPSVAEQRNIVQVLAALADDEQAIETSIAKSRLIRAEIMRKVLAGRDAHWAALSDAAVVSSGSTPSRSREDYWSGGTVPWVRTAEINFSVIKGSGECVTRKAAADTGLRVYPPGTVLLAMYGEGVTRGRAALLGVEATVNQATAAIACDPLRLNHQYLYYWLENSYEEIRKIGQGSNQTNLNGALVGSIRLPFPSVEEQRDLVAPIQAFDKKLAADAEELAKLRMFKQGLTDDLLSGKVRVPDAA